MLGGNLGSLLYGDVSVMRMPQALRMSLNANEVQFALIELSDFVSMNSSSQVLLIYCSTKV